jgi:hypothetical protein
VDKILRVISTIAKAVAPVALALGVGACANNVLPTNFDYVRAPSFDKVFIPNPTEFAPKQPALTAVGPGDLVDANGYCAGGSPPPAPAPQTASAENASDPAAAAVAPVAPTGQGVALQMTECQVVAAAGQPASVQISSNERGNRIVTMTYTTPERPIYRFEAGRLDSIERGAEPPPEPKKKPVKKPVAKKKYVPPKTQS